MIYFIIIVNLTIAFKLWWDYRAKKSGRIINHKKSVLIDGLIFSISALILFDWLDAIGWVIMAGGYRWIAFDLLFNLLNNDKWNHYGNSAMLDRFMKKIGVFAEPIKLAVIGIGYIITTI